VNLASISIDLPCRNPILRKSIESEISSRTLRQILRDGKLNHLSKVTGEPIQPDAEKRYGSVSLLAYLIQ
jgi:hypothetical protein